MEHTALHVVENGELAEEDGSGGIRSVVRALRLLALVNTRYAISLNDLHKLSGLPKPTVYRILATLLAEGFVEMEGRQGVYRVSAKVKALSAGYSEETRLVDVSRPILLGATLQTKWPLALGVLDGLGMTVRFSTMPHSPMANLPTTLGHRLGLLTSAMGYTYLAYCPDAERERLIALARAEAPNVDIRLAHERIGSARRRGYGLRPANKTGDSATAALPIRSGGQVIGVLSMTTFGSIMTEGFIQMQRPVLDKVVADIEAQFTVGGGAQASMANAFRVMAAKA